LARSSHRRRVEPCCSDLSSPLAENTASRYTAATLTDIKSSKKKKKSASEMQEDLRVAVTPKRDSEVPEKPPFDVKKVLTRVGLALVALWVGAVGMHSWSHSFAPYYVVGVVNVAVVGAGVWVARYIKRSQELGALLRGADTAEGRKDALHKLETDYKKGDVQALLARAQLEMQEDPRKALATLETVDLGKQLGPVADQVRSMRAMIHLTVGEIAEARALVDGLEIGKQQEAKTRAMFATVAGEAWGRTGNGKKAVETLELFNPEDPDYAEMRVQMWRARAFAYAGANDMKGATRALRKLSDISPQLMMMFVQQKKIHPLLEKEAKGILMKSGSVPRKMVRQRM
jgi:hypothetical protein